MRIDLAVHIISGSIGILAGFAALFAVKGDRAHRKSGMIFVYAMLTMSLMGAGMAALRGVAPQSNIPAGLLTAYLVFTGLVTVRPLEARRAWLGVGATWIALAVAVTNITFAVQARMGVAGFKPWMMIPFTVFGSVAMLAVVGDVRVMRGRVMQGSLRLARHLWRMSFALLIAAFSFFVGQAKVFPRPIRIMPLLMVPPLAVLVLMLYWLWRVRVRRKLRGIVIVALPEPA